MKLGILFSILILAINLSGAKAMDSKSEVTRNLEITKVYRTNMTHNDAHKFVTSLKVKKGALIELKESIAPEEHQPKGVTITSPLKFELEVSEIGNGSIKLEVKGSKHLTLYKFNEKGVASPATVVVEFLLNNDDPIQLSRFESLSESSESDGGYGVTFQLRLMPP